MSGSIEGNGKEQNRAIYKLTAGEVERGREKEREGKRKKKKKGGKNLKRGSMMVRERERDVF